MFDGFGYIVIKNFLSKDIIKNMNKRELGKSVYNTRD